jgi:hypothetical protein
VPAESTICMMQLILANLKAKVPFAVLHQNTSTATPTYSVTETRFSDANLTDAELAHITSTCGFIQGDGRGVSVFAPAAPATDSAPPPRTSNSFVKRNLSGAAILPANYRCLLGKLLEG